MPLEDVVQVLDLWGLLMVRRYQFPRGEKHPRSRLSEAQVEAIRARRAEGKTLNELAAEFGCSRQTIWSIISGRTRAGATNE